MYVLVFQRKPYLHLINRFNSLKEHFDAHNYNQKKRKKKHSSKLFGTIATFKNILKINEYILTNY